MLHAELASLAGTMIEVMVNDTVHKQSRPLTQTVLSLLQFVTLPSTTLQQLLQQKVGDMFNMAVPAKHVQAPGTSITVGSLRAAP
jgi:hypothetical protein